MLFSIRYFLFYFFESTTRRFLFQLRKRPTIGLSNPNKLTHGQFEKDKEIRRDISMVTCAWIPGLICNCDLPLSAQPWCRPFGHRKHKQRQKKMVHPKSAYFPRLAHHSIQLSFVACDVWCPPTPYKVLLILGTPNPLLTPIKLIRLVHPTVKQPLMSHALTGHSSAPGRSYRLAESPRHNPSPIDFDGLSFPSTVLFLDVFWSSSSDNTHGLMAYEQLFFLSFFLSFSDLGIGARERREDTEESRAARIEKISGAVRTILECIGEDPDREGLLKTPERYAKALMFFSKGYEESVTRKEHPGQQGHLFYPTQRAFNMVNRIYYIH